MLKNKSKLLALITAFTISAGLITPVKSVKADKINVEAVHNIESVTLNEDGNNDDYLIDLTTGKVVDDESAEEKQDTAQAKLMSSLKKGVT